MKVTGEPPTMTVSLKGEVPRALEEGFDRFDIKPGMLVSSHAKQGKNGPYVDVPLKLKASTMQQMAKNIEKTTKKGGVMAAIAETMRSNAGATGAIRRISARSKPSSWIHAGFKGIHAFVAIGEEIRSKAREIINSNIRKGLGR